MEEELMPLEMEQQIFVTIGKIDFPDYVHLKEQALELADHIAAVQVDAENIKQSKKLLAEVNKRLKELEDRRIAIKKLMLEPYNGFEGQVKEIVGIVKQADDLVRQQVKALEENERYDKQTALQCVFDKRIALYGFNDLFTFDDFIKPQHLNKSVTFETVEKEMVQWLEKVEADLVAMEHMGNRWEILDYYRSTKDLAAAMNLANQAENRRRQVEASKLKAKAKPLTKNFIFSVFEEKDFKLLKLFMEQNEIKFDVLEEV